MKKNIRTLIIASILGLIALSFIQGFLINNTYKLKKEAFIEDTKRSIFRFDDNSNAIDSIYSAFGDFIVDRLFDYKLNKIRKEDVFNNMHRLQDSLNNQYVALYQNAFKERKVTYPVQFQKRLKSLIILDSIANDTIFFESKRSKSRYMIGEQFNLDKAYGINNSQTTTDLERDYMENGEQKFINIEFQVVMQDYFSIVGWESKVLSQMVSILTLSILIFILVIGLLYYSIQNLITQKKIADVKTDFINNITHELKTPLATLALSTKMLKKEEVMSQPQFIENTINTIERQNQRLQKLIDQVVNNSIGYSDIVLNKEQLNIEKYLDTVLNDFELSVRDKNVQLERLIGTNDVTIELDRFYFTTAIINILENAVKYNSENVNIKFKAEVSRGLLITISDNGIGIPENQQEHIFEKFYRASDKEVHNVKGLGLGLYYTSQIIKAHQGDVKVKSRPGHGTIFIIDIPLA